MTGRNDRSTTDQVTLAKWKPNARAMLIACSHIESRCAGSGFCFCGMNTREPTTITWTNFSSDLMLRVRSGTRSAVALRGSTCQCKSSPQSDGVPADTRDGCLGPLTYASSVLPCSGSSLEAIARHTSAIALTESGPAQPSEDGRLITRCSDSADAAHSIECASPASNRASEDWSVANHHALGRTNI